MDDKIKSKTGILHYFDYYDLSLGWNDVFFEAKCRSEFDDVFSADYISLIVL